MQKPLETTTKEKPRIRSQAEFLEKAIGIGAIVRFLATKIREENFASPLLNSQEMLNQLINSKRVLIEKYIKQYTEGSIKPNDDLSINRLFGKLGIKKFEIENIAKEDFMAYLKHPKLPELLVELDRDYFELEALRSIAEANRKQKLLRARKQAK